MPCPVWPRRAAGGDYLPLAGGSDCKNAMQEAAKGCTCPPEFPVCVCGKKPQVKWMTRKPVTAGAAELQDNPRARSAKLRVCEKLA